MKFKSKFLISVLSMLMVANILGVFSFQDNEASNVSAASFMTVEKLNRGISAINTGNGMLVSWRYLANDPADTIYKLYRDNNLIYTSNANEATCFLDANGNAKSKYHVDTIIKGKVASSDICSLISGDSYFDIPLSPQEVDILLMI